MPFHDLSANFKDQSDWRILLVDEDEDDFILIRTMLSEAQDSRFKLEWASTYQAGKDALKAETFDAVLMNYDFGAHSGVGLIREAITNQYPAPILLLSGRGHPEADIEGLQAGAADYLYKDELNTSFLERSIRYAIERRRMERELDRNLQDRLEILASIQDGFFAIDQDWRIIYINQKSAQNMGLTVEELLGKNVLETFPKIQNSVLGQNYRKVMNERVPMQFEMRGLYKDQWYNISIAPAAGGISVYWQDITERKQAEEALQASEKRYRRLFETMQEGLIVVEAITDEQGTPVDFRYIDVNPQTERYLGKPHGQIVGRSYREIVPHPDPAWIAMVGKVARSGEPVSQELYSPLHARWMQVNSYSPQAGQAVVFYHDITERKRAEEALRESEQRYSALFNAKTNGIAHCRVITNEQGQPVDYEILQVNDAYEEIIGIKRADIEGRRAREVFPGIENFAFDYIGNYGRVALEGGELSFEAFFEATQQWLSIYIYSPKPGEFTAIFTDISQRKRAEEALRESEERERERANEMETLMDAVPVMIWISRDPECREMIGNRAGYEFLRMHSHENISKSAPEAALANQHYQNMKDGRPIPAEKLPMQIAAATGKPTRDYSFDLVFDDGTTYNLIGNVNPLFAPNGKPAGAIGAFVDITELRKLQTKQLEDRAQIEIHHRLMDQREKDRQAIARDIHDGPVQTLSSTLFNIQFAKGIFTDPQLRVEMEQIELNVKNAVQELRQVIYELRPPSVIRFGLAKAIRFHAEDLREKYPELKIVLHLAEDENQLSELFCLTLFRIYQEAITNVIRHAEASKAWVRFSLKKHELVLEIRDNGKGLPNRENIGSLTENGHYGLAGIKERGEAIGGKLNISSDPGKGTSIQISVPL